jgi:hypothetical protein
MAGILYHLLKTQLRKDGELIRNEAAHLNGFMKLLMKERNGGEKWTKDDRVLLKHYLRRLALYVPAVAVFLLPFGVFLIPILAEVLDRRKTLRDHFQS